MEVELDAKVINSIDLEITNEASTNSTFKENPDPEIKTDK